MKSQYETHLEKGLMIANLILTVRKGKAQGKGAWGAAAPAQGKGAWGAANKISPMSKVPATAAKVAPAGLAWV